MRYRLALDLGSNSLGWVIVRLDKNGNPCAIVKAGVRIFSNGRNPRGESLAVTRRNARAMRRRRDRLLKRKARLMNQLIAYGFFPEDQKERKSLEKLNPYVLRAKGLDEALMPHEFGRALFHINQRRGFKSNRKTDKSDNDSGVMKEALKMVKAKLKDENCRTVGEWLYQRTLSKEPVRARYREKRVSGEHGIKIDKSYDLYIDRGMVEAEFDALWETQAMLNPEQFTGQAYIDLKETLLYQRELKSVKPGRCTFFSDEERAPLALPSVQRFRILQEANNLRILQLDLKGRPLDMQQRNTLVDALEKNGRRTFLQIRNLLGLESTEKFNLEDVKRTELKGNATSVALSRREYFGKAWFDFPKSMQDEIVMRLLTEENEVALIDWLQEETGVGEEQAENIMNVSLPDGYTSLSIAALERILPELEKEVQTYDKAVVAAGFEHHSNFSTGEIWSELPYYGIPLQKHVGFGTGDLADSDEKQYGRIANPTVHIGLNQIRTVVNSLLKEYGHPEQVVIEVARELKQSREKRNSISKEQAENRRKNEIRRKDIANLMGITEERVMIADLRKWVLWEELNPADSAERRCPYTGEQISISRLFSPEVEIEHILPFSRTLDDSMGNKTLSMRKANRIKGNLTPWEAFGRQRVVGYDYEAIVARAALMHRHKRYRFAEDGYEQWLKKDDGFAARALNDTRYLSRIARDYLSLVCPGDTWVIPGHLTAMLRRQFGLDGVLGRQGEKNRDDHRHHAVDACVIAVTDRSLLQKIAQASASAREKQLGRLLDGLDEPWPSYRQHVERAVSSIRVSHRPDHSHEGAMHNDTAYGFREDGRVTHHKIVDGKKERVTEKLTIIPISDASRSDRHGLLPDGSPRPYKGYKGDSNYCIEIVKNEKNRWAGEVISTFEAYQVIRKHGKEKGVSLLRSRSQSVSGKPLVMRLMRNDSLQLNVDGERRVMRVVSIRSDGAISLVDLREANADARDRNKNEVFSYTRRTAGSLQRDNARFVTVSPTGVVRVYLSGDG